MNQYEMSRDYIYRDRYEILERLGGGGFGSVYKARDRNAKVAGGYETVAIKYIASESRYGELTERQRLRRQIEYEIRILQNNSRRLHFIPNYVDHWFEAVADDVLHHYLVMEFIAGKSLRGDEGRPWLPEDMASFLEEMLGYLEQLHQLELFHRDLKPDNIVRRAGGRLCIVDFGFSKQEASAAVLGMTPAYASPEHFNQPAKVEAQSDLYCLGATAYHLFSGAQPPEARNRRSGDQLSFPSGTRSIPRAVHETILELMAYDLPLRPASARVALERLRERLAGARLESLAPVAVKLIEPAPASAGPPPPSAPASLSTVDDPGPSIDLGAETVTAPQAGLDLRAPYGHGLITGLGWSPEGRALLITTAIGVYEWQVAQQNLVKLLDTPEPSLAAAFSPDGRDLTVAQARWIERRSLRQNGVLDRLPCDPASMALVSFDGGVVAASGDAGLVVWQLSADTSQSTSLDYVPPDHAALSGDGGAIALLNDGRLRRWRFGDSKPLELHRLRGAAGALRAIALDYDGSHTATATDTAVQLWDDEGFPLGRLLAIEAQEGPIERIALDQAGEQVAIAGRQRLFVYALGGKPTSWQAPIADRPLVSLAFSPDGSIVAAATTHKVWVWSFRIGEQPRVVWADERVEQLAFLDGMLIGVGSHVVRFDTRGGDLKLLDRLPIMVRAYRAVATFHKDGRRLLALAAGGEVQLWAKKKTRTGKYDWHRSARLPSSVAQDRGMAFTADGGQLVSFTVDALETWQVSEPADSEVLVGREPGNVQPFNLTGPIYDAALSADGTTLAIFDGEFIKIWRADRAKWQHIRILPTPDRPLNTIALSRDGRVIALGSDRAIMVYSSVSGDLIANCTGEAGGAERIVFASAGGVLAAIVGTEARLWHIQDDSLNLKELALAHGHTDRICDLVFVPGRRFVTASQDGTIRLWSYQAPAR